MRKTYKGNNFLGKQRYDHSLLPCCEGCTMGKPPSCALVQTLLRILD